MNRALCLHGMTALSLNTPPGFSRYHIVTLVCHPLSPPAAFLSTPAQFHQPVLPNEPGQVLQGCPRVYPPLSLSLQTQLSQVTAQYLYVHVYFVSHDRDLLAQTKTWGPQMGLGDDQRITGARTASARVKHLFVPLPQIL